MTMKHESGDKSKLQTAEMSFLRAATEIARRGEIYDIINKMNLGNPNDTGNKHRENWKTT